MSAKEQTILVIDDDPQIGESLRDRIEALGLSLEQANDGRRGLQMALEGNYALIVLDLNLPSLGGMEICKQVKTEKPLLPVIMLTSRNEVLDKVLGLELGADDYVTKPFDAAEMQARIKARFRNRDHAARASTDAEEVLTFGDMQINLTSRQVVVASREITLTSLEYDLLVFLARNPGRSFTRDELAEAVWDGINANQLSVVNVIIARIRKKLGDDVANPRFIATLRGFGYRFEGGRSSQD